MGFYASFIAINAYDQPGVEAGKRCAGAVLALQSRLMEALDEGLGGSAAEIAKKLEADEALVFHVLRRLAAVEAIASEGIGLERVFSKARQ